LSDYHLAGDVDIIFQIGPGLFGVRDEHGQFDPDHFMAVAQHTQVKAFEIKLAQGAKTRGGHIEGKKVTEEIAKIRKLQPYETVDSPNRFDFINNAYDLLKWIDELREMSQKPVGFKMVLGRKDDFK
ncbi:glutamate synthase-related protein, partial [Staphylococcus pseudintermedius]